MSPHQHHQQLPGAVVFLALSIVTLAAVLAGIERDRSRRHARSCAHHARCSASDDTASAAPHGESSCSGVPPARAATAAAAGAAAVRDEAGGQPPVALPTSSTVASTMYSMEGKRQTEIRAAGAINSNGDEAAGQRLEILVHNVSHKDMVLSLRRTRRAAKALQQRRLAGEAISNVIDAIDTALARPKFSLFKPSSELILNKLRDVRAAGEREPPPAVCPVHRRGGAGSWSHPSAASRVESVAVGFDLDDTPIPISDLAGYRVRSEDLDRLIPAGRKNASRLHGAMNRRDSSGLFLSGSGSGGGSVVAGGGSGEGGQEGESSKKLFPPHDPVRARQQQQQQLEGSSAGASGVEMEARGGAGGGRVEAFISGVYFPLLSVLMPKWLELLAGNGDDLDSSKTVLLVSGVGQPRNEEHRFEDNSTEVTAMLMEAFLKRHYPAVRVVRVHSDTNIFRYDDNIRFVKTELLPLLNAERSRMAEKYGGDWQDMMHITMSFADGSPARISSINTALRHFRPSFIHIWELKTFWHEKVICEDDVEVHTFEDIDMQPPIPASEVDAPTALIIAEMQRLRSDLERILAAPPKGDVIGGDARDDLSTFWLRKTKRPVLAVLLVQKKGGEPQLYRGTNMEVSLPTGSLCAERNAIGSALTADLSLLRRDIKAVAVLSVAPVSRGSSSSSSSSSSRATAGVTAAGKAGLSSASGGGDRGRSGKGAEPGAVLVSGSPGTSLAGSSVVSRVPSPLVLTPAMKFSPKSVAIGAGAQAGEEGKEGGLRGGAENDEKRLEGVRQALYAVAAEDASAAPTAPASAGGGGGGGGARRGGAPPEPRQVSTFFLSSSDVANLSNNNNNNNSRSSSRIFGSGVTSSHVRESVGHSQQQQQQQSPQQGRREVVAAPSRAANPRLRSESCADELLSAGRITTTGREEEPLGSGGGESGGSNGIGKGAEASGAGAATAGLTDWEGAAWGAPSGRSNVSRSQSLDLTAHKKGEGLEPLPTPLGKEEELSRRKILRGTKIVRSLASTPIRGSCGSGEIFGGGGGGGGGGIINSSRGGIYERRQLGSGATNNAADARGGGGGGGDGGAGAGAGQEDGVHGDHTDRSERRGGNNSRRDGDTSSIHANGGGGGGHGNKNSRSSVVAHVPGEALCSNPLKPCGACMEWLKKIAEVNPDFKVVTFTDSRCGGVYIEDVAQILL